MKSIYLLAGITIAFGACNKFGDINTNPNLPSKASSTQLIANAELYLPVLQEQPQGEFNAQYLSETQYVNNSLYQQVSSSFYGIYQGPLMNLETVLTSKQMDAKEGPIANQLAVAKILKAYYFWHITDRWGDVPYKDALKGNEKQFTPAYDTQESIYTALFALLDDADKTIVAGDIQNDIVFNGNMASWKKLGNTIRLLMALRLSEVPGGPGQAEFNKALTAGIITSNAGNLVIKHLPEEENESYWYQQWTRQNRKWWALSALLVNTMKPVNDPRLPIYGDKNNAGQYVGLTSGQTDNLSTTAYSNLGAEIRKQDASVYLVTYAQALFALAEAAKLGWIAGGDAVAATHYNNAIEQSVIQWTGSNAGVAAMMASPGMAYAPATGRAQIATQRWVHLFMHGYEAWAEWRRTGSPALIKPGGTEVPNRQGYPPDENFNNKDNYNTAVARQFPGVGDGLYGKVWWDKP